VGLSRGYSYRFTMTPWKTQRKSMVEWDYRTRIISLLSSMKPGRDFISHSSAFLEALNSFSVEQL
jgi:hypothetical protein